MASHPSNTRHPRCIPLPRAGMLALALLAATAPVHAQQGDTTELATLRAELESLKAEEAERDARIQRIEEALLRLSGETTAQVEATGATATTPSPSPAVVDAQAVTAQATASDARSEEHTSELQSLMRTSYAVFCLKKKKT